MALSQQFGKSTTLAAQMAAGATTGTLASDETLANFTSDYLVLDYNNATLREAIRCDLTGTAISNATRAIYGSDVTHAAGAAVGYNFLPKHYEALTGLTTNVDGATITFNLNLTDKHQVTLGGNRTLAVSNATAGQAFAIKLIQDGTGSRTVTWFATITWAGGSPPTLTTTASKADWFGFIAKSASTFDGFVIGQNI